MKGREYRELLPRAVRYYRNGRTFDQIRRILGGCPDVWHLLIELSGEISLDEIGDGTIQEAVAMKSQGMTQREIAARLGIDPATLSRALRGRMGIRSVSWREGKQMAREALADYQAGLDLDELRWKYGYRTQQALIVAMNRIEDRLRG
jgi:transposase-like protein